MTSVWTRIGLVAAAFLAALIFLSGPVDIWARNSEDLAIPVRALAAGGAVTAVLAFVPLAALVLLTPARWRAVPACILAAVALLAWTYSSFLFRDSLAMDGRDSVLSLGSPIGNYEWPLLALAVGLIAFALSRAPRPALMLLLALLVGNLGLTAVQLVTVQGASPRVIEQSPELFWRFGRSDNVLAILLDGLQSDVAADELEKDASLAAAFEGFTFFRNTTGVAPSTYPTMPTIHSGRVWDPTQSLTEQYHRDIVKGSFLTSLARSGYESVLLPPIRNTCPEDIALCAGPAVLHGRSAGCPDDAALCQAVERVVGSRARHLPQVLLLFDMSLVRAAPFAQKSQIHNAGNWLLSQGTQAAYSAAFMARARESLDVLAEKLTVDDGPPTAKLIHVFSTHHPYVFDAECKVQPAAIAGGIENAARCSLRSVAEVLKRMKASNIYDSSTLLIFADHGAGRPSTYRPSGADRVTFWPATAAFANPVLMVKPPGAHGALANSMHDASIGDIAATVCSLTKRCTALEGQSVFALSSEPRARKFYWYEWRNEYWTLKSVPGVRSFTITGPPWEGASWAMHGPAERYVLGAAIKFDSANSAARYLGPGWSASESWGAWTDGERAIVRLAPVSDRKSDVMLTVRARGFVTPQSPRQDIDVRINGRHAGMLSFDSFEIAERQLRIPAAAIGNAEIIEIAFLTKHARSPAELGLSADHRRLGMGVESITLTPAPVEVSQVRPAPASPYSLSNEIDFRTGGNAAQYATNGWASSEAWGTWADGEHATLRLAPSLKAKSDLVLTVHARAFVVPQHPRQDIDVLVNGRPAGTLSFDSFDIVERSINLPAGLMTGSDVLELTFVSKAARSPAELGVSVDPRRLGIGIATASLKAP